jgi:hypothetical protein
VSASVTDPNRLGDATVTPELIDGLRSDYEHVIVAAPPLLPRSQILSEVDDAQVFLVLSIGARPPGANSAARGRAASDGCATHRCGAHWQTDTASGQRESSACEERPIRTQ